MSEFNFGVRVNTTDGENRLLECHGENTELYRHHPNFKDVDHFFIRIDERDRRLGAFLWRQILGDEQFEALSLRTIQSGEFIVVYRPEPTDSDMQQFLETEGNDLDKLLGDTDGTTEQG